MAVTYPPAPGTISGDVVSINRFLKSPPLVARTLQSILRFRYIADALLTGRFRAVGGAVQYETGESIFATDDPRAIAPGGEYPLTTVGAGAVSIARTVKWGSDTEIYDEAIARMLMNPVNKALAKMANSNVKLIDGLAMSAIASAVTATGAATADWSTATASQILKDVLAAKQVIVDSTSGAYDPDTVVVDTTNWGNAMAAFVGAGFLPREATENNPVVTGDFPTILGMKWLATPFGPATNQALVLDSTQLGGMADEDLGGEGYVSAAGEGTAGVEVKVFRLTGDSDRDGYRLRARRTTVPIIIEPAAARKITGL